MSTTAPASTLGRVINIISAVFEVSASTIEPHTRVGEIWIDSLDRVELGMWIEEDFALQIPDRDVDAWATVADIVAYLDGRP